MENSSFSIPYMLDLFPKVFEYLQVTLVIAIIALILGLIMGIFLAIIKIYKISFISFFVELYVNFLRSTPFIVQLFLFYYGLASISDTVKNMSPEMALTITLSINASAYIAEIIRGAIESVPIGQMEACLSCGMKEMQAMCKIILPQAIRVAVPSLSNTFVDLIKSTAIGFTIGVMEMLSRTQLANASSFRYLEGYITVAIIYWIVIVLFSCFQKKLENRLGRAYKKVK